MMMDGAEKRAVIFFARISGDGAPSPKPSLSAFFPEDRDRKSGKTEAGMRPDKWRWASPFAVPALPLAFPRKITRFGKAHPDPRFPPAAKGLENDSSPARAR